MKNFLIFISKLVRRTIGLALVSILWFAFPTITSLSFNNVGPPPAMAAGIDSHWLGKRARIELPCSGYVIEHKYLTENSLQWKLIETPNPSERKQSEQTFIGQQINPHLIMLNWIEYDGASVTEVIDTKQEKVWSYWTFSDERLSQRGRSSVFETGTFRFID